MLKAAPFQPPVNSWVKLVAWGPVVWIHGIKGTHRAPNHQCTIPVTARNLFMALRRPSFRKVTPAQDIEKTQASSSLGPRKGMMVVGHPLMVDLISWGGMVALGGGPP